MIRQTILLAAFVAVAACACDVTQFDACQNQFTDYLGLDKNFDWTNPMRLSAGIQQIYIHGSAKFPAQSGLVSVCNAYNILLQCLAQNGQVAQDCFNPIWMLKNNPHGPYDAYGYAGVMNMVQYQCSAGFYPAVDNWECVQGVYSNQDANLRTCIRTFYTHVRGNPGDACEYFKTGLECYSRIFRPCRGEIEYYACETFRVLADTEFKGCNMQCQVNGGFRVGNEKEQLPEN